MSHFIKLWGVSAGPIQTEEVVAGKFNYVLEVMITGPYPDGSEVTDTEEEASFKVQPIYFVTEEEALEIRAEIEEAFEPLQWEVEMPDEDEEGMEGDYVGEIDG